MSFAETTMLGAFAGLTIGIGLPFGRLRLVGARARVALAMFAVGVLAFLFVDVLAHAIETVDVALEAVHAGRGSVGRAAFLGALLAGGFALGCAGLASAESRMRRRNPEPAAAQSAALRAGMVIAGAIGLHNFAEGLSIGVSAGTGELTLAAVLVTGFALHNATEGFAIVGPLREVRPSWRWLATAGFVGGGPTLVGTVLGYRLNSDPLALAFYAVSGGAILYVIGEIWSAMRRHGHRELGLWLLATGFAVGVATDLVVVYGGA